MSIRTLGLTVILAMLVLFGCGRKEETAPEKSAVASRAASEQEPSPPAAPVSAAPGAIAADDRGAEASAGGNRPPTVINVPFKEARIHRGIDIEVLPEGLDPDGDLVSFRFEWFINGEKLSDLDAPVLPGDRFQKGDRIALKIVPYDGKVDGVPFTGQPFTVPNAPPRFVSTPPLQFQAQNYIYEARAEDPDLDTLTFHLEAGPKGMIVDAETGRITWPIDQDQNGDHLVRLVAKDVDGMQAVQEYTLTIRIAKQEGN